MHLIVKVVNLQLFVSVVYSTNRNNKNIINYKSKTTKMKKMLLILAAFVLSLGMNAQSTVSPKVTQGIASSMPTEMRSVKNNHKPAAPARLETNQRLVGYYTTDDLGEKGVGFLAAPGNNKAAIFISPDILENWVGYKIVGMRFGLCYAVGASRIFLAPLDEDGKIGADLAEKAVSTTVAGWNTAMFDQPIEIKKDDAFMAGFDYKQGSNQQSDASYPLSAVAKGSEITSTYIYGNVPASSGGQGLAWYNINNMSGNLSVQLIVSSDNLPAKQILFNQFSTDKPAYMPGTQGNVDMTLFNNGTENIGSYVIDLTIGGKSVGSYTSAATLAPNTSFTVSVPFNIAQDQPLGATCLIGTVKTIDNAAPATPGVAAEAPFHIRNKVFVQNVVMEEYTGTGCGYCPVGLAAMEYLNDTYGDRFIGIGLHQFNSSDPMYNTVYARLGFTGAPQGIINRNGSPVNPYTGGINAVADAMKGDPTVGVSVKGAWNESETQVNAVATVESTVSASNYSIVFVLLGDSLTGTAGSWKQSNYLAGEDPATYGNEKYISRFLKGGIYGQSSFSYVYEDVMIGSSYNASGVNQASLGAISPDATTVVNHTIGIDSKDVVKNALKKNHVRVVAMVLDNKGKIINAAQAHVTSATGIADKGTVAGKNVEVARYTIDGQKINTPQRGINIVKMSDGSTVKVMVK